MSDNLVFLEDYVRVASKYGGVAFGSYVRDIVVPRLKDNKCEIKLDGVDLWFKTKVSACQFVGHIYDYDYECCTHTTIPGNGGINDPKLTVFSSIKGLDLKIYISETFPIQSFNVNCLTYGYWNGVGHLDVGDPLILLDIVVKHINIKHMII